MKVAGAFVAGVLVGIGYVSYRFTGQTLNLSRRAQAIYEVQEARNVVHGRVDVRQEN